MQNAFVESFNGRLRNECLNEHVFSNLAEARSLVEEWRIDYNTKPAHITWWTDAGRLRHAKSWTPACFA